MASDTKFLSIKSLIIWVVMAITSLSLILSSGVNLYSQISTYRQSLQDNMLVYAEIIGRDSIEPLIKDEGLLEEKNLKVFSASELIENVHIYKILDDQSIGFFASYNKEGIAPVKAKFNQIIPHLDILTPEQAKELLQISIGNNQVHHAGLCASEYLPPIFAKYGHLLDLKEQLFLSEILDDYVN